MGIFLIAPFPDLCLLVPSFYINVGYKWVFISRTCFPGVYSCDDSSLYEKSNVKYFKDTSLEANLVTRNKLPPSTSIPGMIV